MSPPAKQLSDEDIRHKAIGLADEYFGIKDLKVSYRVRLTTCYNNYTMIVKKSSQQAPKARERLRQIFEFCDLFMLC